MRGSIPAKESRIRHIPELDGLRALAIGSVLFVHVNYSFQTPLLERMRTWGWVGVDLFFVISGFLITSILVASKDKPGYYLNFYARRGLRIWPLYYILLFYVFVVAPRVGGWAHQSFDPSVIRWEYFAAYIQNLVLPNLGPFPLVITWSLCVEEQFYMVWPFCVRLFSRRNLTGIALAVLVAEPVVRFFLDRYQIPFYLYFTLARLDSIAVGTLVSLHPRWFRFAWLALPAAVYSLWKGEWIFVYSTLALGFGWIVNFVVENARSAARPPAFASATMRVLRARPLLFIGKTSYGIYVWHTIVYAMYFATPLPRWADSLPFPQLWNMLFQIALPLPFAALSWYAVEAPVLKLKRFFEGSRKREVKEEQPEQLVPQMASGD